MSLLQVLPDVVLGASANLEKLGAALGEVTAAVASRTTVVAAPAADEVSEAITALLGTQALEFQAVSAKAAAFHEDFVSLLNGGVAQYVSAEMANVENTVVDAVNAPAQAVRGAFSTGSGQALAAAVHPAESTYSQSLPIGPFEAFYDGTQFGLRLNTPFGPVALFSEGFSISIVDRPDYFSSLVQYHFTAPFIYLGTSILSSSPLPPVSLPVPLYAITFNGIELAYSYTGSPPPSISISWLGTPFYGVLPRIGYSPFP